MGMNPEEIVLEDPHLNPAQVHAALAYYNANPEEIEADIEAENQSTLHWESRHAVEPQARWTGLV